MQNVMAALVLGLAGLIIWRSWWTIVVRHAPALARVRGKREDDPIEAPVMPAPAPWFAPPTIPMIELKAARVRSAPAAGTGAPAPAIGRRAGWNPEDDAELLRILADDTPAADIASRLGRSENRSC